MSSRWRPERIESVKIALIYTTLIYLSCLVLFPSSNASESKPLGMRPQPFSMQSSRSNRFGIRRQMKPNYALNGLSRSVNAFSTRIENEEFVGKYAPVAGKTAAWVRALELFEAMKNAGISPDTRTINDVMTICLRCGRKDEVKRMYSLMQDEKVEADSRTLSIMAGIYGKSKEWENALTVMDDAVRLGIKPDLILFTNIISACAKEGQWSHALDLLARMQDLNVTPTKISYNAAIHACCKGRQMKKGEKLVQEMKGNGIQPDVVTYTSLIAGHMWQKDIKGVIGAFKDMQRDGISPNGHTYSSVLTAFTRAGLWRSALDAYATLLEQRITASTMVHNMALTSHLKLGEWVAAVTAYTRMRNQRIDQDTTSHCLALEAYFGGGQSQQALRFMHQVLENEDKDEAKQRVFETAVRSCQRHGLWQEALGLVKESVAGGFSTQYIFNTAIAACAKTRQMQHAFDLYDLMKETKIKPTAATFNGLMASTAQSQAQRGWEVALEIERDMLSQSQNLDQVTYTGLITALGRAGRWQRAEKAYLRMIENGVQPNHVTYSAMISAWGNGNKWERAIDMFSKLENTTDVNEISYSCVISAMGKCGQWEKVLELYSQCDERLHSKLSLTTYNAVLSGLARNSRLDEAVDLVAKMHDRSRQIGAAIANKVGNYSIQHAASPNAVSYGALIEAADSRGNWEMCLSFYNEMREKGIRSTIGIANRLLRALFSQRRWSQAVHVFDKLTEDSVPMDRYKYSAVISACVRSKDSYLVSVKAHNLFRDMRKNNIVPRIVEFGAIIHACAKEKNLQRALLYFEEMANDQISPNQAIFTSLIKACAHDQEWEKALELFNEMENVAPEEVDLERRVLPYNALITTLTNCRQRHRAMKVFDEMKAKNIMPDKVTYDRLAQGFEVTGEWEVILRLIDDMHKSSDHEVSASALMYQRAISACQVKGKWEQALEFYETMIEKDLKPREATYLALYDACLNAKKPEVAAQFYNVLKQSTEDDIAVKRFEPDMNQIFDDGEDEAEFDDLYDPEPIEIDEFETEGTLGM